MKKTDWNKSSVLVTGGTGSFGQAFISHILAHTGVERVVVYSRDEMKQWVMASDFRNDPRIRFFIGDVRDKERLLRAMAGIDYVVHAAATKIVPTAEYNPMEAIKTNVIGAMNVIEASLDRGIKKVVALSTDKASSPINLYGATKLASDKLFVASNSYSGRQGTKFSVVRYGNVMGSRGSLIPLLLRTEGPFPITDKEMTRFMISLDQGIELVMTAFDTMHGGELYVRKIPSMKVVDIARAIDPNRQLKIVGIRPGEKIHEQMISVEEAPYTFEFQNHYRILPIQHEFFDGLSKKGGQLVESKFSYSSDTNKDWMTTSALAEWIIEHKASFIAI